ncbi:MAG: hypothetical protein J1F39_01090 [Clostridiales bacterium]|nr:hypothetical protein [Clostridiales bacterium]
MSKGDTTIETLNALNSYYDELGEICNDESLKPFGEKPPEPKVAKWRMQRFDDSDCEKLAAGKLEFVKYKREKFTEKHPQKPVFPKLDLVAWLLFAVGIFMLVMMIVKYADLKKIDEHEYEAIKDAEFIIGLYRGGAIFFGVAMVIVEVIRICAVKSDGLISYFKNLKLFPKKCEEYRERLNQHEEKQQSLEDEYDADVLKDKFEYSIEYALYVGRREKYNNEQKKIKKELAADYSKVVEKIKGLNDIPQKYINSVDIDFENLDNTSLFYERQIEPLQYEVDSLIDIISDGRADTFKEAINCFLSDEAIREQERIAEMERRELERNHMDQLEAIKRQSNAFLDTEISELRLQIENAERDYINKRIDLIEKSQIIERLNEQIRNLERQKE